MAPELPRRSTTTPLGLIAAVLSLVSIERKKRWLAGAGIEWAFAPNWSAKIEYDYLGLANRTFTLPPGGFLPGDTFTTGNPSIQM